MDFLKSILLGEARMKDAAMDLVYKAVDGTPTVSDHEKYLMKVVAKVLAIDKDKLFKGDAVAAEKMVKSVLGAVKEDTILESEKIDGFVAPERKPTGYGFHGQTELRGGTNPVMYQGKEWIRTGKSGTAKNGKKAFEFSIVDDERGEARIWVDVDGEVTND